MSEILVSTMSSATPSAGGEVAPAVWVNVEARSGPTAESRTFKHGVRKDSKPHARQWRVLRRFRGIIIDPTGDVWTVGFIEGGRLVEYEFPSEPFRKHGITSRFQPFEMDEIESIDPGISASGYRYRPLATEMDVFLDEVELGPEQKRLRDLILQSSETPAASLSEKASD